MADFSVAAEAVAETAPSPVLVVGPAWVGDMVMAQSLFKTLKAAAPDHPLDVLAPAWSAALLARMPEVRDTVTTPFTHGRLQLGQRRRVAHALKSRAYRRAIILPNSYKSALIPWFARIPRRTGYVGEQRWGLVNDIRRLDRQALPMTVQRFVALAAPRGAPPPVADTLPAPALCTDDARAADTCSALGLDTERPVLALCPGAEYGPAKRWPVAHFAAVARAKHELGWQVWLLGSTRDREACDAVRALTGPDCVNLAGRTTLEQVIDVLSRARLVVSNDSGLMHIAAALDRPLIALYGSSDPGFTPPLSPRAQVLWLHLECSPCFERHCPLGHTRCLKDITPERVLDAAESLES